MMKDHIYSFEIIACRSVALMKKTDKQLCRQHDFLDPFKDCASACQCSC